MKIKPYLTLLVGVVAISFAAIFIRLAEAPPLVIATYRLSLAAIILSLIALRGKVKSLRSYPESRTRPEGFSQKGQPFKVNTQGEPEGLSSRNLKLTTRGFYSYRMSFWISCKRLYRRDALLMLLASTLIALHFWLWITSLEYTSIASSVILVTSHPVFVAIVSYFLWGERLNKIAVSGILFALVGVILVNLGGLAFSFEGVRGDLLALVAGLAMGVYLIVGRELRGRIDVLRYLVITCSLAATILLILTLSTGHSLFGYSRTTYLMMLLLALVPQLIGHSCLNVAVRRLPATIVSVAILGEPVGATLLGFFLLKQAPTLHEVAGGLLILGGIYLTTVPGQKPDKTTADKKQSH